MDCIEKTLTSKQIEEILFSKKITLKELREQTTEDVVEEYKRILKEENINILTLTFSFTENGIETLFEIFSMTRKNLLPRLILENILRNGSISLLQHFIKFFVNDSVLTEDAFKHFCLSSNISLEILQFLLKEDEPDYIIKLVLNMARKFKRIDVVQFVFKQYPEKSIISSLLLTNFDSEFSKEFINIVFKSLSSRIAQ